MIINEKTVELSKDNAKWQMYAGVFMIIAGILVPFIQDSLGLLTALFVITGIIEIVLGKVKLYRIENFYAFKEIIGEKTKYEFLNWLS